MVTPTESQLANAIGPLQAVRIDVEVGRLQVMHDSELNREFNKCHRQSVRWYAMQSTGLSVCASPTQAQARPGGPHHVTESPACHLLPQRCLTLWVPQSSAFRNQASLYVYT